MDDIQTEPGVDRKSFLAGAEAALQLFIRTPKLVQAMALDLCATFVVRNNTQEKPQ